MFGSSLHNYIILATPCMGWAYSGLESRLCNEGDGCLRDPSSIVCLIDLKDGGVQGRSGMWRRFLSWKRHFNIAWVSGTPLSLPSASLASCFQG